VGWPRLARDSRSPGEEFLIAIAGPVSSFLLAVLFFALWYVGRDAGLGPVIMGVAAYIGALNLVLAVFNMLPGFPMDGGRVLRAVIWKATGRVTRATLWASRVGVGMAWLLTAYGAWEVFRGAVMGGIWLILIAWFIRHAARASYRQHLMGRMQEMAEDVFRSHFHEHPYGPDIDAGRREVGGRDVTNLGGGGDDVRDPE
jgi:Zn-dependent protease